MDNYIRLSVSSQLVVIGDIHGCYYEFLDMIDRVFSTYGEDTFIISVGDTVDRGDFNLEVIQLCFQLQKEGKFIEVQSNHNLKLYRWFKGKNVNISYGMQKTVSQILSLPEEKRESLKKRYISYYESLPLYVVVNDSIVVAHAGIKDEMVGKTDKKVKRFCYIRADNR
ncbi:MAG: metallophosphoesterase [Persephonella sp.]|nr:metallophosphoesterase [Persephonella sp.]